MRVIVQTERDIPVARWEGDAPRVGDIVCGHTGPRWRVVRVDWITRNANALYGVTVIVEPETE